MTAHTSTATPPVMELLTRQLALFEHLHRLSEQQGELIDQGPTDALLGLLARRKRFTDALIDVQSRLEPFRGDWARVRTTLSESEIAEADRIIGRSGDLLDQILGQDDRDRDALRDVHRQVGSQLAKFKQADQARHAYQASHAMPDNRYTNRQG